MATDKIQQRYRIGGKYIDMITKVEKDNNLNSKGAALEYLLEENIRLKQLLSEKRNESITEDTSNILKAINQSSKDIKTILEFINTYAYREMFEENISATETPTNWLNEAKEEVNKQIQYKRTKNLSKH